jgi:hypothetical protein
MKLYWWGHYGLFKTYIFLDWFLHLVYRYSADLDGSNIDRKLIMIWQYIEENTFWV